MRGEVGVYGSNGRELVGFVSDGDGGGARIYAGGGGGTAAGEAGVGVEAGGKVMPRITRSGGDARGCGWRRTSVGC